MKQDDKQVSVPAVPIDEKDGEKKEDFSGAATLQEVLHVAF
jgi:hypothetical protein